jgi:hypothetical protein
MKNFTIYTRERISAASGNNLATGNIKCGATIFWVNGSVMQATGNATHGAVLSDWTFSNFLNG